MSSKKDRFSSKDSNYMKIAINLARSRKGLTGDNPSVGCVIVKDDKIISIGLTGYNGRPHAEHNAIKNSFEKLEGSKMYVTLEPCPMCLGALYWSQISRIVYSAKDKKNEFNGFQPKIHPKTTIEGGVLANQTEIMLKEFFKSKRS